jgi:sulfur carrier protein
MDAPTIQVNGQPRAARAGMTLAALLEELKLAGQRVAVERNGELVPRSRHADTALAPGDRLEIVRAIGGG